MPTPLGPGDPGSPGPGQSGEAARGDDLDRRRRSLESAIAARQPPKPAEEGGPKTSGMAGMAYALRLSSEFIAGIVVGVAIGWIVDRLAGTSPWGLIVFLLLGFGAGVLNVLRSAGLVAEHKIGTPQKGAPKDK